MIILIFLLQLKLKDETSGQEYELEAGVGIQVEQYTDFWRELPVRSSDDQLQGTVTICRPISQFCRINLCCT